MALKIDYPTFLHKATRAKDNPYTGTVLFTGHQGAGKTISAIHYIKHVLAKKFPDMQVFTNINVEGFIHVEPNELSTLLLADYGRKFTVFFLDEIQILFDTKLENGKQALSREVLRYIAQQRKGNKTIVGTLQEFLDLEIKYRRQLKWQVQVRHLDNIQFELWRHGSTLKLNKDANDYVGPVSDIRIFKRNDRLFQAYDTFEIVSQSLNATPQPTPPAQSG